MMRNVMISDTLIYYEICSTIKKHWTFEGMKNCNKVKKHNKLQSNVQRYCHSQINTLSLPQCAITSIAFK